MIDIGKVSSARAVRFDRAVLLSSLGGIVGLAWLLTIFLGINGDLMMSRDLVLVAGMWSVMMVAMMLPSISPTLFMFVTILRGRTCSPLVRTAVLAIGYLLVWFAFAVGAAIAQILFNGGVSFPSMLAGIVLVAAGIFQFTSLKQACLRRCRSPQGFFMTEWCEGIRGAMLMGLKNGLYCLGCCWLLMLLLFIVGAMNLLWMAALAILVLLEKAAPRGEWLSRAAGLCLITAGAATAVGVFPHLV